MDYEGWFWLPWTVTIAVILLSLLVITKSLKKKELPTATAATAVNNTASTSAAGGEHEVFLSFSGEDTRLGFTDYLYTDLVNAGIRTFRDADKLRAGEKIGPELLKAIEESKISIPIFSKNYASSKWCLLELSQMVECQKNKGQKVLPIFYDVKPSDVRHQTGSYKNAFLKHEKDFDEKTVQGWKEALREVVDLKGWELKKETNGHQGKLVTMVVSKVLLELKKNYMVVDDNLVGIDHHVEKMKGLLNVGSDDVSIVGIHGMGGIGKTTIAKVIHDQLLQDFDCCCFLTDVRETSLQNKGIVDLQNQLISEILKRKHSDIIDVNKGINTIKDTVWRKKVLLILDDVDHRSQFDKLAGKRDWFGSGSRIIVTTRSEEVLKQLEVDKFYEPVMMEPGHSLELFSRHAFRSDSPPKDYDILSNEIVSTAAGLPLALVVFGSLFMGKGKDKWEELLAKSKKIPNNEVLNKLMISYEALEHEQKQIFLDIACLFIGKDKKYPCYMWDACGFYPQSGLDVLVLRSLVKIQDDGKFRMHDHLRDLGREIVRRENLKDPGERSRLWDPEEDFLERLERRMGTKKVEALILDEQMVPFSRSLTNEDFEQLPKLRYLEVGGYTSLTGDFKHLLSELRWLEWYGIWDAVNIAPTSFHLKNLVILRLSNCSIKDDTLSEMKMLKVLRLSIVDGFSRLPNLSINLRELRMSWCDSIRELPDSIGNLEKLEQIDIYSCKNLKGEIPGSIGRLSSLRILRLCHTGICGLPTSVCGLSGLQTLDLRECKGICSLPTSVCGLSRLQTLDLRKCEKLESLPELPHSLTDLRFSYGLMTTFPSLSYLVNLEKLCVYGLRNNPIEIPTDFGKLFELETCRDPWASLQRSLIFSESYIINSLPAEILGLPSSLFKLRLDKCFSLERLPDLSNWKILSTLKLFWCSRLKGIQGLEQLESLRYLHVSYCELVERLSDLSNLKSLKKLRIYELDNLTEIRGLEELESLEVLVIEQCKLLKLPDLSNLKNLKSSSISLMSESLYDSEYKSDDSRGMEELKNY